jgi:hypothetical protein
MGGTADGGGLTGFEAVLPPGGTPRTSCLLDISDPLSKAETKNTKLTQAEHRPRTLPVRFRED